MGLEIMTAQHFSERFGWSEDWIEAGRMLGTSLKLQFEIKIHKGYNDMPEGLSRVPRAMRDPQALRQPASFALGLVRVPIWYH